MNEQLEQLDFQPELDSQLEGQKQKPKRRRGAQPGNMNGFLTGTSYLKRAKKGKLYTRGKRVAAEVMIRLTEDLGGPDRIGEAQRILIAITAKQCGRLDRVHRLYRRFADNAKIKNNLGALIKLDAMVRPLEAAVVSNLQTLGFKRVAKVTDVYDWQPAGEQKGEENPANGKEQEEND